MQDSKLNLHLAEMLMNVSKMAGWSSLYPLLDSLETNTLEVVGHDINSLVTAFQALCLLSGWLSWFHFKSN